jgi:hypothetical protein
MRKVNVITVFTLSALLLAMMTVSAMAYTIDGDLGDWGVNPTSYYISDGWQANSPAISIIENWDGGPNSDSTSPNDERCDIEAFYMDDDKPGPYIYFAMILSVPEGGFWYGTDDDGSRIIRGDLALDLNSDVWPITGSPSYGYEYGVKLTSCDFNDADDWHPGYTDSGYTPVDDALLPGDTRGDVWQNPGWAKVTDPKFSQTQSPFSNMITRSDGTVPTRVFDATYGLGQDIYTKKLEGWFASDNNHDNYVLEMRIPKSSLGISDYGTVNLQTTMSCTNDLVRTSFDYSEIPEFTTIAVPVCMILGMFYFFRRKRQTE